jgi:hypothetical protein
MWSEWLARTLKPRPARKAPRPTEVIAENRVLATEATAERDGPAMSEECAVAPHEAAVNGARAAARGAL